MTTPAFTAPTGTLPRLREVVQHLRHDPAPRWEEGSRARLAVWVGGSMVAWTAIGLGATALLGALVDLVA
jgi:hypothetical protein